MGENDQPKSNRPDFTICSKCGGTDIHAQHYPVGKLGWSEVKEYDFNEDLDKIGKFLDVRFHSGQPISEKLIRSLSVTEEHHKCHCRHCHYDWLAEVWNGVADPKPPTIGSLLSEVVKANREASAANKS